ncbi:amp dependent CoA ligase, partial [Glonium stellatum]
YRSVYASPHLPTSVSISQYLEEYNPNNIESQKVIFEDDWTGKRLTYSDLRDESAKGAFGLRKLLSVEEEGVVCICAPNSVNVVLLIHAILRCGGTAVLINPLNTSHKIAHCLNISRPQLRAADSSTWLAMLSAVQNSAMKELKALSIDTYHCPVNSFNPLEVFYSPSYANISRSISFPELFSQTHKLPALNLSNRGSRDCTAVVCFNLGTTGKPKGVELSHYNIVASMAGIRSTDPTFWNGNIRGVFFAPLCHICVALMGAWLGYYTMLMKQYSLKGLLKLSAQIEANALQILTSIAVAMTKDHGFDLSSLRKVKFIMCSGAILLPKIIEFLHKSFSSAPIFQGYGMTETNISTLRPEEAHMVGSVDRLFANVEARIVDDDMNDGECGKEGEMLIRGPSIFRRYMNDPVATQQAFHDGWMRTGDILRIAKNGFLYLTERKKELIKYKGIDDLAPAELENILNSHPQVKESAVCAAWDEAQGTEIPIAYVVLTDTGKSPTRDVEDTLAAIKDYIDTKVSPYKRLRGGVVAIEEIPETRSGKILRRLLPARMARERHSKL